MKVLSLALLAGLLAVSAAEAGPGVRSTDGIGHALEPLKAAATECFTEAVMANPGAMAHARAGRWYQAAGVIGFICRPEVDAMIRSHDAFYGRGAGNRYFKGAYAKHLDQELAIRLQPLLERKAVASAEPAVDKSEREAPAE